MWAGFTYYQTTGIVNSGIEDISLVYGVRVRADTKIEIHKYIILKPLFPFHPDFTLPHISIRGQGAQRLNLATRAYPIVKRNIDRTKRT